MQIPIANLINMTVSAGNDKVISDNTSNVLVVC